MRRVTHTKFNVMTFYCRVCVKALKCTIIHFGGQSREHRRPSDYFRRYPGRNRGRGFLRLYTAADGYDADGGDAGASTCTRYGTRNGNSVS